MSAEKQIIPAILTDDLNDFKDKYCRLKGLTEWLQIDVMDGKFVETKSISLKDLDLDEDFKLEIDLMVNEPERYFEDCQRIKAKRVLFHPEATDDIDKVLETRNKYSFQLGLALNPETGIEKIRHYLNKIKHVLLLGVNPGFQNQTFIENTLEKIKELRKVAPDMIIEVDGGIKLNNVKEVFDAGADICAVGSAIVKTDDFKKAINDFNKIK